MVLTLLAHAVEFSAGCGSWSGFVFMPPPLVRDIHGGAKALKKLVAFDWLARIGLAQNRLFVDLRTIGINKS
jgi:hypothetical protein